ncbi:MAG: sigma-54-dependent Fis family transcriptional regulator [Planctomycetaceae bacterium]|nr:sigma-54-dependent Fis family transcriptional regulator [Planctomycetaceae bacterium]
MSDEPLVALVYGTPELRKALWSAGYHPFLLKAVSVEHLHHDGRLPRLAIVVVDKKVGTGSAETIVALTRTLPLLDVVAWAPQADGTLVRTLFRAGAKDVLVATSPDAIVEAVAEIVDHQQILPKVDAAGSRPGVNSRFESLWSRSPAMWDLFDLCDRIAGSDATVLIIGETGTGKELFARAIHRRSGRQGRFVSANCSSISSELIDTELFGHEQGAFTGATHTKTGLVRHAEGGTLLLDEIGDMPSQSQLSLLRMLQERCVRPVGGQDEIPVDVRVVAATNASLEEAVERNEFREDLFYRLDVIRLTIPPLRDRREDIVFLLGHFVRKLAKHYQLAPPQMSAGFLDAATSYDWPGNVRQLENFAERTLLSTRRKLLTARDFATSMEIEDEAAGTIAFPRQAPPNGAQPLSLDLRKSLAEHLDPLAREMEVSYLTAALQATGGRIQAAAEMAGLNRRTLLRKLRQYGIDKRDFK